MNIYKTNIWIPLVAITSVVVLYIGYQFNIYDQEDHLPQVYKLLSPELYAKDFFVNEYFKSFNVRFFYVSLVYLFSKIIGVYASVTLLHFVCLASTVFLVYKLTIKLGGSHIAGLLAALLLPTVFNTFNLGLSNFVYSSFIAGSIAAPLCIYAFYNYIDNRFIAAAIAAGLACLFQVLMGVQVFLLLSIGMLFKYKEVGMKQIAYAVLAFLLFSGPMLMPMVYQQFLAEKVHDSNLVVQILAYIRNPHHYVPSYFPLESYVKFAFIVVAGLGLLSFLEKKHRETLILFYGVSILGMIVYYVGFELLSINALAKTQWFKISVWIAMFSVIAMCIAACKYFLTEEFEGSTNKYITYFSALVICISAFVLFNSANVPSNRIQGKYQLGNYAKSDLSNLHAWINDNTDVDATFLVPPNDESFLCEAQRAALVSYKPMIHQENYQVLWLEKMEEYYGVSRDSLVDGNAKNTLLVSYYSNFSNLYLNSCDFIIAEKDRLTFRDYRSNSPVFESGNWILLKN